MVIPLAAAARCTTPLRRWTQYTRHIDFCIDHHAGNSGYADFTLLDGQAAAAAELLYEVIMAMKVPMTAHIANCLYTGLSTDTGCFRFSSTTAKTHLVAAKLIEAGAQVEELNTLLFDTKVGLTLRQQPGGSYRISVRTAKGVDACAIARRLGGGGHTRAAGCELLGNLDNTKSAILAEVEAELDAPQTPDGQEEA